MGHRTSKTFYTRLARSTASLSCDFRACIVVFHCTTLRSSGDSSAFSNTGHKSSISTTQLVFLPQESNKVLHNNIELCSKTPVAQYSFTAMILSNHIHRRRAVLTHCLHPKIFPSGQGGANP